MISVSLEIHQSESIGGYLYVSRAILAKAGLETKAEARPNKKTRAISPHTPDQQEKEPTPHTTHSSTPRMEPEGASQAKGSPAAAGCTKTTQAKYLLYLLIRVP